MSNQNEILNVLKDLREEKSNELEALTERINEIQEDLDMIDQFYSLQPNQLKIFTEIINGLKSKKNTRQQSINTVKEIEKINQKVYETKPKEQKKTTNIPGFIRKSNKKEANDDNDQYGEIY